VNKVPQTAAVYVVLQHGTPGRGAYGSASRQQQRGAQPRTSWRLAAGSRM